VTAGNQTRKLRSHFKIRLKKLSTFGSIGGFFSVGCDGASAENVPQSIDTGAAVSWSCMMDLL
jgi:hypothetical protein